jgi:hypothetical protein
MLNVVLYQNGGRFLKVTSLNRVGVAVRCNQFYRVTYETQLFESKAKSLVSFHRSHRLGFLTHPPPLHRRIAIEVGEFDFQVWILSIWEKSNLQKKWSKEAVVKVPCLHLIRSLNAIHADTRPNFLVSTQLSWAFSVAIFNHRVLRSLCHLVRPLYRKHQQSFFFFKPILYLQAVLIH